MKKTAILLMAYGGPDKLEDVAPYLLDVRGGRPTSPELTEEIKTRYAAIGGNSPLLPITRRVAQALEEKLQAEFGTEIEVFVGMRHWFPYIRETAAQIVEQGFDRLIALCMTPFDSRFTTEVYFLHLDQALAQHDLKPEMEVVRIPGWYQEPGFAESLAQKVTQALSSFENEREVSLFFSAHSLPAVVLQEGDPYPQQFQTLAAMVAQQAGLTPENWQIAYQSAGAGKIPWLGPDLEEKVIGLGKEGTKDVLVAPIGFLCDHVEILYDLDIELLAETEHLGMNIKRTQSLNDDPLFINFLAERITKELT
jgi:ferrochelatase